MDLITICLLLLTTVLYCNGVGVYSDQMAHNYARRYFGGQVILGAPSRPSHLPPAEPILPGHTLLRPSMGMLKSSVKFPHREQENGSGVYGHIDTIGIRYDGKNERLRYSGFRRMLTRRNFIVMLPEKHQIREEPLSINEYARGRRQDNYKMAWKNDPPDTETEEETSKTKLFWNTQDSYNHIKINEDAPEHSELMPSEALEDVRNWWFYHQMDFTEFKDVR